jgi:hypothetical protein
VKEVFEDEVMGVEVMERFQLLHDLLTEVRKHVKQIEMDFFSLTGEEFGDLQVIGRAGRRELTDIGEQYIAAWKCHCTCGTELIVDHQSLIDKTITNCGGELHGVDITGGDL